MKLKTTVPRPKRNDPDVILAAARGLAPALLNWSNQGGSSFVAQGEELERTVTELADILKYRYNDDGYSLAKNLEHNGWDADSELVEIMDEAAYTVRQAWDKACQKWVADNKLKGPAIGAEVTWLRHPDYGVGKVRSDHADGRSTVAFASQGHVTEGVGCHGNIIEWEELELVNTTV